MASQDTQEMLAKLLALTTSDNDAEALAALRKAQKVAVEEGLDFKTILSNASNRTDAGDGFYGAKAPMSRLDQLRQKLRQARQDAEANAAGKIVKDFIAANKIDLEAIRPLHEIGDAYDLWTLDADPLRVKHEKRKRTSEKSAAARQAKETAAARKRQAEIDAREAKELADLTENFDARLADAAKLGEARGKEIAGGQIQILKLAPLLLAAIRVFQARDRLSTIEKTFIEALFKRFNAQGRAAHINRFHAALQRDDAKTIRELDAKLFSKGS